MCIKTRFFRKRVKHKTVTTSLQRSETGYRKIRRIRWFWLRSPYDYEPGQEEPETLQTKE